MNRSFAASVYESQAAQVLAALVIYSFYAAVLAVALLPSAWIAGAALSAVRFDGPLASAASAALLAAAGAAAVYAYFIWGAVWMAAAIRLISLGAREGRYPKASLQTFRWLLHSGIHTLAMRSILPFIPVSYFANLYFKIMGARIGRNVYINTNMISDAYMLTLEDGVILGGDAELTCHIMEREHLVLRPIRVGKDSLIGTGAYISPGVDVGERCTVGARCYIRQGTRIEDDSVYTVVAGLPARRVRRLERDR